VIERLFYGPGDWLVEHTTARQRRAVNFWLLIAWIVVRLIRGRNRPVASVWFGTNIFDGVLFPVLALALAYAARVLLTGTVKPAVFKVAESPVPETVPAVDVQLAIETGTLSGLVQLPVRFTVPPGTSSVGFADTDIAGGFFGGSGFTV